MSSREKILKTIRDTLPEEKELPSLDGLGLVFDDKEAMFTSMLESVGGKVMPEADWSQILQEYYPEAKIIATDVPECDVATLDLESQTDPHDLSKVDLAIVKAEFAVAENGAVWIKNPSTHPRAIYYIAEHIIFVVPKGEIVDTMHDAYKRIDFKEKGFGCFISGPSKTADIEQSLVIGAHGATSAYVLFK